MKRERVYEEKDWEYDSKWADHSEFLKTLSKIDLKHVTKNDKGGVPLVCENGCVYVDATDSHSLIIGSTGSKKTRLIAMPTLQILAKTGESFVVTDPKGELHDNAYPTLVEMGYNILVVNLRDPSKGHAWNPLSFPYELYKSGNATNKDKARELLDDLAHNIFPVEKTDDPFWENSAQDFFLGLTEILFKNAKSPEEVNLRSICLTKAQTMSGEDNALISSKYYKQLDKESFEYICLAGTVEAPDKTRTSILSVFNQYMRIFAAQDALVEMLSSNEIDFESIGNQKTALFLIIPDEKTTYHKLVSIFIKQCYERLIYHAQKLPEKSLPVRVNFVLDEFSSLPKISDFPAMITAARSRNIRFDLFIQSEHQLKSKYNDDAQTIKSNCNNWIFLTSRELPLLEEISKLAGDKQRNVPLISVSKLQRLRKEKGEALIFHARSYPHVSMLDDISKYQQYSHEILMLDRERKEIHNFNFLDISDGVKELETKPKEDEDIISTESNINDKMFARAIIFENVSDELLQQIIDENFSNRVYQRIENILARSNYFDDDIFERRHRVTPSEYFLNNLCRLVWKDNNYQDKYFIDNIIIRGIWENTNDHNDYLMRAIKKVSKYSLLNSLGEIQEEILQSHDFKKLILLISSFDRNDILEAVENDLIKYYKMESILDIMLSEKSIDQKRKEVYFVFTNKI